MLRSQVILACSLLVLSTQIQQGSADYVACGSDKDGAKSCPDGQYCQPWNPNQYQCRSLDDKCGAQETGIDYNGDDLQKLQLTLPEQCCDACFKTDGCVAYTFVNYNPDGKAYCYLKKGTGNRQNKVGVVSAKIKKGNPDYVACGNEGSGATACPDGQYCQPWNPNQYQCRSIDAKCGAQEAGVDYYGDDLQKLQVNLPEQCCDACFNTDQCTAYTFVNYNSDGKAYCYLKKGTGKRQNNARAVSAKINKPSSGYVGCGTDASGPTACPDGQYCQPWNPNQYQCRSLAPKCGAQETGIDYYGDDLGTVVVTLPEQCCDICSGVSTCVAYTYVNYNTDGKAYCYLKKGTGERRKKTGAVSAKVQSSKPADAEWSPCGKVSDGAIGCPDKDYCQPWNANYFQCVPKPAKCSALVSQVDLKGDDLKTVLGVSPWDCCEACASTDGCKTFTFVNDNKDQPACFLKSGDGTPTYHPTAVSGSLN